MSSAWAPAIIPSELDIMEGDRLIGGDNHVNPHVVRTNGDFARGEHLLSERQPDFDRQPREISYEVWVMLGLLTKEGLCRSASGSERRVGREETVVVALPMSESREGAIECNAYTKGGNT